MRYDWHQIVDTCGSDEYDKDPFRIRHGDSRKVMHIGEIKITKIYPEFRGSSDRGPYLDLTDDEVLALEPLRAEWNASRLRVEESKRESDRKNAEREVERSKLADARKAEEMRAKVAAMTASKENP